MKILILAPGESIHTKRFIELILDLGHQVVLIDSINPFSNDLKSYRFIPLPKVKSIFSKFRTLNKIASILTSFKLRRIWNREKPHIVHLHWVDNRALLCVQAGIHPLVLTCWGSDINELFKSDSVDYHKMKQKAKALRGADFITADTHQVLERCDYIAKKQLNSELFYFGIDLEQFRTNISVETKDAFRKEFQIPSHARIIFSVRRLVPMMGHHKIISAFSEVIKNTKHDIFLLLHHYLGKDLGYEIKLQQLADNLGISSHIIWLENIPDEQMPVLYSISDVIVNFPDYDGLPVSLFEAAACRRPIITNNLEAYEHLISKGFLNVVSAGNVAELGDTILKVINSNQDDLEQQLDINYTLVSKIADQRKCIKQMEKIYLDLIGGK